MNQLELISDLSPNLNQAAPISADGCKVVFATYETPLKGGLYLRDRCLSTPRTVLISDTDNTSAYIDISANGKRIVYSPSSGSSDHPMNDREYGVHVLDLESNISQCISTQQVGNSFHPAGACRRATTPSMSADGSRVVFFSIANLFGSDFNGGIYLYDKNNAPHLSLIQPYEDGATMPSISPDGRYVAFQSYKSLAGEDNEPRSDVFIQDTVTGDLVIASISSSGEVGNGESPMSQTERPSFSADGTWVLFSTGARNLTPRGGSVVAYNIYTGETIDFSSSSSFYPYPAISSDPLGRFVVSSNPAALDNRFSSANGTSGNIYLHDRATHCILNWAELNYPDYFAPGGQSTQFVDYFTYRYYPMTNTYLGTFSQDDHLYYLGPGTGGEAADIGSIADLIEETGCLKN